MCINEMNAATCKFLVTPLKKADAILQLHIVSDLLMILLSTRLSPSYNSVFEWYLQKYEVLDRNQLHVFFTEKV